MNRYRHCVLNGVPATRSLSLVFVSLFCVAYNCLCAVGADGDNLDGSLQLFFEERYVSVEFFGEFGFVGHAGHVGLPSGQLHVDRLYTLGDVVGEVVNLFTVHLVGYACLDGLKLVEHVALHHNQLGDTVYHDGILQGNEVNPTTTAFASGYKLGFYDYRPSVITVHGEQYRVSCLARFTVDEEKRPLLMMHLIFPELANERRIKLYYAEERACLRLREQPGKDFLPCLLNGITAGEPRPRGLLGFLSSRLNWDYFMIKTYEKFEPLLLERDDGTEPPSLLDALPPADELPPVE